MLPRALYDEFLQRTEGGIKKKDTWYRKSLRPSLNLSITLRHLACVDSYRSLSYNFRVAPSTNTPDHSWGMWRHQSRVCCWGDTIPYFNRGMEFNGRAIWKKMAIPTLLWCVGWQACGSYMSLELWLPVQKLQRFLLFCPDGLSRCRLQVFVN